MCYISAHLPHSIFEVGMTNLPTIIKNKIHQHVYELRNKKVSIEAVQMHRHGL